VAYATYFPMESASPELPKSDTQKRHSIPYGPDEPIFFWPWNEILAASQLSAAQQESFRSAVVHFLRHCKESECPATVVSIKAYLKHLGGSEARIQATTEALRWFNRQAVDYRDAQEVVPSGPEAHSERTQAARNYRGPDVRRASGLKPTRHSSSNAASSTWWGQDLALGPTLAGTIAHSRFAT